MKQETLFGDIDKSTIDKVLAILEEEVVPAEGCTEPIALAYVAAKAREVLGKKPDKMNIYVSGNMIKNVKSVVVPKSGGKIGIEVAAAMGAIAGKPEKELMVIQDITKDNIDRQKNTYHNNLAKSIDLNLIVLNFKDFCRQKSKFQIN